MEQCRLMEKLDLGEEDKLMWRVERDLIVECDGNTPIVTIHEFACVRKSFRGYKASIELLIVRDDGASEKITAASKKFDSDLTALGWLRNVKEN